MATRVARSKSATTPSSCSWVAPLIRPRAGMLKRVEGASDGWRLELAWATSPACPSWADTMAPSAWTASVSGTRSSISFSVKTMVSRLTRPPIDTAQYATVVSPTPPLATATW